MVDRLNWRTLMDAKPDTPEETISALDRYFDHFVQVPFKEGTGRVLDTQYCVGCNEPLTGFVAMVGRGGFRWGLAHGEGNCAGCGWPARAHHFIKDEKGKELLTLRNFILQVHPDFVSKKDDAA